MIVCSCNVISDHEVRDAASNPTTAGQHVQDLPNAWAQAALRQLQACDQKDRDWYLPDSNDRI